MPHSYALFSPSYVPREGEAETFASRLALELQGRISSVTVVTPQSGDLPSWETQPDGVTVRRLPTRMSVGRPRHRLRRGADLSAMLDGLLDRGIDRFLVCDGASDLMMEGLSIAAKAGGAAVVLEDGVISGPGRVLRASISQRHDFKTMEQVKRLNPTFAAVSRASAAFLAHFGIRCQHVVPSCIDADNFGQMASDRDFYRELGMRPGQTLVAYVGRISAERGADELLEAASLLDGGFAFAFAGEGPSVRKVEACGLPNVHALGELSRADRAALLSQAALFCTPGITSTYYTTLLEAGACGALPVMRHVAGVDEVIGSPAAHGVIIEGQGAEGCAVALRRARAAADEGMAASLIRHIRQGCSWEFAARSLEAAFEDAERSQARAAGTDDA